MANMHLLTFYAMPTSQRFGTTYHICLHSHWAQQFVGLNFTNLLSNHLHKALQKVQSHHHRAQLQTTTHNKFY
jgi:hypothetical protein